ncbi:MAG: dephospho-CoA kinase [Bacteroidetes bacterium]|nr:MAG: dephospho-CoA kinase [Bacteroidota bacterium]
MLKVGLTGGIGSGKSTIAAMFEALGIPVYYADDAAKEIMNEDEELKLEIISLFGSESYTEGKLNRKFIASLVFNDKSKLESLNALVHPATIRAADKWMQKQSSPYVIKEAALIFESGSQDQLDYVIGVFAPQTLRIHRVMKRDGVTKDEVLKRMSNQIDDEIKMRLCNFVIKNDDYEAVLPQVLDLHNKLIGETTGVLM